MNKNSVRFITLIIGILSHGFSLGYTGADCATVENLASRGFITYQSSCQKYNLDAHISRQEVAAVGIRIAETC